MFYYGSCYNYLPLMICYNLRINLFTIKTSNSTIHHTCLNFNRIYLFFTRWEYKAIFLLGNIMVPISGRQEVVR